MAREDIAVAGAVADMVFRCDPLKFQGADRCLCKEAVQIRLVGRAEVVHIDVHGGSEFGGRFLACIHDLLHLGLDLGLGVRADLTGKGDFIRNDVGGCAALDAADIGGCLRIDAAEFHLADGQGRSVDGIDAFFWFNAAVGGFSVEGDGQHVLSGAGF